MKISLQNVMFSSAVLFSFSCSAPGYDNPSSQNSDRSASSFRLATDEEQPKGGDQTSENEPRYRRRTEHGERAE